MSIFYLFIVSFDSDGPSFIPISTQGTITCSSTEDPINSWSVILRHITVFGATPAQGTVARFGNIKLLQDLDNIILFFFFSRKIF